MTKARCIAPLLIYAFVAGCDSSNSPVNQQRSEKVTIEQPGRGERCRVRDRAVLCDRVGTVMLHELNIPTDASIVLQISRTARYDEVAALLRSLQDTGYVQIEFGRSDPPAETPTSTSTSN